METNQKIMLSSSTYFTSKCNKEEDMKCHLGASIIKEVTNGANCKGHEPTNHFEANDGDEEDPPLDSYINHAMNRGALLRQWKLLALAEEEAAANYDYNEEEKKEEPMNDNLLHGQKEELVKEEEEEYKIMCGFGTAKKSKKVVLRYEQYLKHQRYYDDYKHVNCDYIDFGQVIYHNGDVVAKTADIENKQKQRLVIQQDRKLGKGGLIWDAAFCLGEHLLHRERNETWYRKTILELGAGTGMLGCWLGKALYDEHCHIMITDLPCLLDLMKQNVELNNFISSKSSRHPVTVDDTIQDVQEQLGISDDTKNVEKCPTTIVEPRVLTWGKKEEYPNASAANKNGCSSVDIIVGADIITSLYDPIALSQTLWDLSTSDQTRIYLSGKSRLDQPHLEFEESAKKLFHHFEKMPCSSSRNVNPNVFIIEIWGKRDEKDVKNELLKTRESTYHK